jgi:hypothetical protein
MNTIYGRRLWKYNLGGYEVLSTAEDCKLHCFEWLL